MSACDLIDVQPLAWQRHAVCASVDPELWFPENGVSPRAVRVCQTCPVIAECRAYALNSKEYLFGVWGGMTEADRRRARRDRPRLKPCGTRAAHQRHVAAGETPCAPCVEAAREYHARRTLRVAS